MHGGMSTGPWTAAGNRSDQGVADVSWILLRGNGLRAATRESWIDGSQGTADLPCHFSTLSRSQILPVTVTSGSTTRWGPTPSSARSTFGEIARLGES